jgi:hypothetical protein
MAAMINPEKIPMGAPRPGVEASTAAPMRGAAYPAEAPAKSIAATAVKVIPDTFTPVLIRNLHRVDFPFSIEARFRRITGMIIIAIKKIMTMNDTAVAEFGHLQMTKKKTKIKPK